MSKKIRAVSTESRRASQLRMPAAFLLALGLAALFAQAPGHAAAAVETDPLLYARGMLVTGNYVAGGVDLFNQNPVNNPPDILANGLATGTIHMTGVPANADILGAFLYWETIYPVGLDARKDIASLVSFRGSAIDPTIGLKATTKSLSGNTATCWGSAGMGPAVLTMFRADVLHQLPKLFDSTGKWTGKRLVNDTDVTANVDLQGNAYPLHTVTLPEGSGNLAIQSAGASLVVIYRSATDPLTKIVLYDGAYLHSEGATLSQNLRAFYQHAGNSGKITHIVGSGGPNHNEQLFFNGAPLATDPFQTTSASSDRSWSTFTSSVSMTGTTTADGYGETANTTVAYSKTAGGSDCLAWGGIVFSTPVLDADGDGLPDALEASSTAGALPWMNPDGELLPDIHGMGARPDHKDIFVEINAMHTDADKEYGSATAPFDSSKNITSVTLPLHSHTPTSEVLKIVGDAYASAPIANLDNTTGIAAHFDVGSTASYLGSASECTFSNDQWLPDPVCQYLVKTGLARGGETITETACVASATTPCVFPAYPGTVGWKFGFEKYRNAPVTDDGQELTTAAQIQAWNTGGIAPYLTHRRRFDHLRKPFFHYVLYAHATGRRKSLPCLVNGQPADYDVTGTSCTTPNPTFQPLDYSVPTSMSGIADLPGGNALVTLGLWDKVLGTGTAFVQASTTFHELGHNLELSHGGRAAVVGSKALGTATYFEPNCKPNYLSSMSYLFQAHGLIDVNGDQHLAYSGTRQNNINETALTDGALDPAPSYRPTWFAPANSALATLLGAPPASRMCNGIKFEEMATPPTTNPNDPTYVRDGLKARVWAPSPSVSNDWNVPVDWFGDDGTVGDQNTGSANVNFDGAFGGTGVKSTTLYGFNDWDSVHLNQIGAGRRIAQFSSSAVGDVAADGGDVAADGGDVAADGGDVAADGGDVAADGGDVAADGGDVAADGGDVAADGGDVAADGGVGAELDFTTAKAVGRTPPTSFRACVLGGTAAQNGCVGAWQDNQGTVHNAQPGPGDALYHRVYTTWKLPSVGNVAQYTVSRAAGAKVTTLNTVVSAGTTPTTSLVDTTELPDRVQFTYFVKAVFSDEVPNPSSGASNFATITAVNDAPAAVADAYNGTFNTTLTVSAATGVLLNDTDDDSPRTSLTSVVATKPSRGTLVLNADGSFSYTPPNGFSGTVTFTYVANDGTFAFFGTNQTAPKSGNSAPTTVTINVVKK